MKMKIGFIGLGNLGRPLAMNLVRAGHEVTVNDLHPESGADLIKAGAAWPKRRFTSPARKAKGTA